MWYSIVLYRKFTIAEAVDKFVKSKSREYCQKEDKFGDWKDKVLSIISNRIEYYKRNCPEIFEIKENTLEKDEVKRSLKMLKVNT